MIRDRWRNIRAAIKQDIDNGMLEVGERLPTEPELAKRYNAGRHSIRRAVTELGKEGLLSVEQGRGTFVQSRPRLIYALGARTRMRRNMYAQGVHATSETLSVEHLQASDRVAFALNFSPAAAIIATRRRSFADGVSLSLGVLFHDASRFREFPERAEAMGSVSAVYASYGVTDHKRASTQMHARHASRRAYHFFETRSVIAARFSICSARSIFSLAFSGLPPLSIRRDFGHRRRGRPADARRAARASPRCRRARW